MKTAEEIKEMLKKVSKAARQAEDANMPLAIVGMNAQEAILEWVLEEEE